MSKLVLLGPQRHHPKIGDVVKSLGLEGRFAVITAGWQEREEEMEELESHLGGVEIINLMLYKRSEELFRKDPLFREAHRNRQERLKRLQDLYRLRLNAMQGAVQDLMNRRKKDHSTLLEGEIEDALRMVRELDGHHFLKIQEINRDFEAKWEARTGAITLEDHNELAEILDRSRVILVAGGHVAVLLNRIRMFNLVNFFRDKHVIAWSAGAMVLGERVVLFHDTPPQGKGFAELFEAGLGVYSGILPLPHARDRMLLDNLARVSVFARRFQQSNCVVFDDESQLNYDGENWTAFPNTYKLTAKGQLAEME